MQQAREAHFVNLFKVSPPSKMQMWLNAIRFGVTHSQADVKSHLQPTKELSSYMISNKYLCSKNAPNQINQTRISTSEGDTLLGKNCHGGLRCLFLPVNLRRIGVAIITKTESALIYKNKNAWARRQTHKIRAAAVLQNNNNNNNTRNAWLASNNCYNFTAALARFCYREGFSLSAPPCTQHQKWENEGGATSVSDT